MYSIARPRSPFAVHGHARHDGCCNCVQADAGRVRCHLLGQAGDHETLTGEGSVFGDVLDANLFPGKYIASFAAPSCLTNTKSVFWTMVSMIIVVLLIHMR